MRYTETISSPVSALSCDGVYMHAATGNRIYFTSLAQDSTTLPTMQHPNYVTLPSGSVVTALVATRVIYSSSVGGDSETHTFALIGAADALFVYSPTVGSRTPLRVLHTFGARIVCVHYCKAMDTILVLTSLNTAFWIRGALVWRCVEDSSDSLTSTRLLTGWRRQEGPALGVVLAADCVSTCTANLLVFNLFAGTYAGHVSEWRLRLDETTLALQTPEESSTRGLTTVVPAHRVACALFSVKVCSFPLNGQVIECCATCSDDRTAAVFVRPADGRYWECWWRGSGEHFSRARVFDVELHWDSARSALLVATAHEDGHVHVEALVVASRNLIIDASPLLVSNVQQHTRRLSLFHLLSHKGHGAYKVAFMPARHPSASAVDGTNAQSGVVYLVSGGFDGTVNATPLALPATTETLEASPCLRHRTHFETRVIAAKGSQTESEKAVGSGASVRGIHIDKDGCVFVMTESAAMLLDNFAHGASDMHEHATSPNRIGWHAPLTTKQNDAATPCKARSKGKHGVPKELLPVRMTAFPFLTMSSSSATAETHKLLAVFTEGGYVVLLSVHRQDPSSPQWSTALQAHGKVVFVDTVERIGARSPLLVTSHILNHTVVSRIVLDDDGTMQLEVLCAFNVGPGVRTTSFASYHVGDEQEGTEADTQTSAVGDVPSICLLLGDKKGCIYLYNCKQHTARVAKVFQNQPVVVIYKSGRDASSFVMATDTGSYVTYSISELMQLAEAPSTQMCESASVTGRCLVDFNHCLRFPFPMSSLLAATDSMWVTQQGHTVTVYERCAGQYSWHCRAAYTDVKAPRLVSARVVGASELQNSRRHPSVYVAHCSDGEHVEGYACRMAASASCSTELLGQTSALLGGTIPGKDFNSIVALTDRSSTDSSRSSSHQNKRYALGNEDSTLTILSFDADDGADFPQTFAGPHHSNILCMQMLPTTTEGHLRLVTAGGLATLAVWERVEDLTVGDETNRRKNARWRVLASRSEENGSIAEGAGEEANGCDRIARFLSLCCTHLPTTMEGRGILVGSSDATLRLYELQPPTQAVASSTLVERASIALVDETQYPKPIMALHYLESTATTTARSSFFAAGDTNGRLAVVEVEESDACAMAVRALQRTEQSCVNAISAGHLLRNTPPGPDQPTTWQCVVGHDSGTIHLVDIEAPSSGGVGPWSIVVRCSHRVGITPVRGLSWNDLSSFIFVLSEEFVQRLSRSCQHEYALTLNKSERINVRGASGFAVEDQGNDTSQSCVLIGQGYEQVFFD